jgi:hypothetical protein
MDLRIIVQKIYERLGGLIKTIEENSSSTTETQSSLTQFIKDGSDTTVTEDTTTPANSIPLPVILLDEKGEFSSGASATIVSTHRSPKDFNVVYTSANTVTLSGHESITENAQIIGMRIIRADNTSETIVNGSNVTMTYNSDVITITGISTSLLSTDSYALYVDYQDKAYDSALNVNFTERQNPEWARVTDEEVIVTAQDTTAVYQKAGDVIPTRIAGYNSLSLNIDLDINDATGNMFKFMSCESDGSNPRDMDNVEVIIPDGADYNYTYNFEKIYTNYVQIYIKHTANSGVTSDFTIGISKSNN